MAIKAVRSQIKGVLNLKVSLKHFAYIFIHQIRFMVLQFLQYLNCRKSSKIQDKRVGSVPFELLSMSEYDIQTLERDLNCLKLFSCEQVNIVSYNVGVFVEVVYKFGFSRVGEVGEDIAYLSSNIVSVSLEELQHLFEEAFPGHDSLDLGAVAGSYVRDDPAGLSPHDLFVVFEHPL